MLGGETYVLCIAGSYTFMARPEKMTAPTRGVFAGIRRGAAAFLQVFRSRSTA